MVSKFLLKETFLFKKSEQQRDLVTTKNAVTEAAVHKAPFMVSAVSTSARGLGVVDHGTPATSGAGGRLNSWQFFF